MTKEERKAAHERRLFKDFAAIASLPIDPTSIESRRPPEPDILCRVGAEVVAFELVGPIDEGLAAATAASIRNPDSPRAVAYADQTLEGARKKLKFSHYESPHPMELVIWDDGSAMMPLSSWKPSCAQRIRDIFDDSEVGFRRVWVVNFGRRERGVWLVHPTP